MPVNPIRQRKLLKEIHEWFGGKCCTCGFSDARALQIDHIDGGGVKELKNKSGNREHYYSVVLRSLKANERKYQVLCANCNWIKRHTNQELLTCSSNHRNDKTFTGEVSPE